ncbi:MAG: hypothetical protein K2W95_15445 [Candidatus Obscuribacterales bacterium]|nr:hypothetical protein [Candidatus Obscuribacterales bacterium]
MHTHAGEKLSKQEKQFRAHVTKLFTWLREAFHLTDWDLELHFCEPDEGAAADINVDSTYLTAVIRVGSAALRHNFEAKDSWQIMYCLTHEFCHILTDPLVQIAYNGVTKHGADFLRETAERQTTRIARILMGTIPQDVYEIQSY